MASPSCLACPGRFSLEMATMDETMVMMLVRLSLSSSPWAPPRMAASRAWIEWTMASVCCSR
jgi:hypothetical protein